MTTRTITFDLVDCSPDGALAVTDRPSGRITMWRGAPRHVLVHELIHLLVSEQHPSELEGEEIAIRRAIATLLAAAPPDMSRTLNLPLEQDSPTMEDFNKTDACPIHPGATRSACGCSASRSEPFVDMIGSCTPDDALKLALLFLRVGSRTASAQETGAARALLIELDRHSTPNALRRQLIAGIVGAL